MERLKAEDNVGSMAGDEINMESRPMDGNIKVMQDIGWQ